MIIRMKQTARMLPLLETILADAGEQPEGGAPEGLRGLEPIVVPVRVDTFD